VAVRDCLPFNDAGVRDRRAFARPERLLVAATGMGLRVLGGPVALGSDPAELGCVSGPSNREI
jgi:hypothetical protein